MQLDDFAKAVDLPSTTSPSRTMAMISTYPPTPCGVATFSAALCGGLCDIGREVGIVRVGGTGAPTNEAVRADLMSFGEITPEAYAMLHGADVVILQHEYGLFDGADGSSILEALAAVRGPLIVVAHTVLAHPTQGQRSVLHAVAERADAIVAMTEVGRQRLISGFAANPAKVHVIPHGAALPQHSARERKHGQHQILTWGLLGPGKGIEWAIDSVSLLDDIDPPVSYWVAGDTHPKVLARDGEAYRVSLKARAELRGVASSVHFDAGYRGLASLATLIAGTQVVVLPYDSPDQVTSGVLVDAVAAGCPVVATAFPHAVELLASGAGLVVPQQDPEALAHALRRVLTEPGLADSMEAEAKRLAPELAWSAVAGKYAALAESLLRQRTHVAA